MKIYFLHFTLNNLIKSLPRHTFPSLFENIMEQNSVTETSINNNVKR
jgi:hypothetical protein